ncbi:MAG: EFR1 family ferrodoxin [Prevotella sp.]|nr:EFR1 family ferrodoxin [Prevotella sp.]
MIFYLSCTGNTKWAAETLSKNLGERLINIANNDHLSQDIADLNPDESVGFCFPVHGWRPPKLVREFIKTLRIPDASSHYIWALCTAGDDIGETMNILSKDMMASLGVSPQAMFSIIMPESYVGLPFMDVDNEENEAKKKQEAKELIVSISRSIEKRESPLCQIKKGDWPRIKSHFIGEIFTRWLITDKPFRVKSDTCVRCGRCISACPVGNIEGGSGLLPSWKHNGNCLSCFACYHHCPTKAIEYGKRTRNKGQYFYK